MSSPTTRYQNRNGTLIIPAPLAEAVELEIELEPALKDVPLGCGLLTVAFGARVVMLSPGQPEAVTMA